MADNLKISSELVQVGYEEPGKVKVSSELAQVAYQEPGKLKISSLLVQVAYEELSDVRAYEKYNDTDGSMVEDVENYYKWPTHYFGVEAIEKQGPPAAPAFGEAVLVHTSAVATEREWIDLNVTKGKYYYYWLTATDDAGNVSAEKGPIGPFTPGGIATDDTNPPTWPTGTSISVTWGALQNNQRSCTVHWSNAAVDAEDNLAGYRISLIATSEYPPATWPPYYEADFDFKVTALTKGVKQRTVGLVTVSGGNPMFPWVMYCTVEPYDLAGNYGELKSCLATPPSTNDVAPDVPEWPIIIEEMGYPGLVATYGSVTAVVRENLSSNWKGNTFQFSTDQAFSTIGYEVSVQSTSVTWAPPSAGTWWCRVRAYSIGGAESNWNNPISVEVTGVVPSDTQAPIWPTPPIITLTMQYSSSNPLQASWSVSWDVIAQDNVAVTGYRIRLRRRLVGASTWTNLDDRYDAVGATTQSYAGQQLVDNRYIDGTIWEYEAGVEAHDARPNYSAIHWSAVATGTDSGIPGQPATGVTIDEINGRTVTAWINKGTDIDYDRTYFYVGHNSDLSDKVRVYASGYDTTHALLTWEATSTGIWYIAASHVDTSGNEGPMSAAPHTTFEVVDIVTNFYCPWPKKNLTTTIYNTDGTYTVPANKVWRITGYKVSGSMANPAYIRIRDASDNLIYLFDKSGGSTGAINLGEDSTIFLAANWDLILHKGAGTAQATVQEFDADPAIELFIYQLQTDFPTGNNLITNGDMENDSNWADSGTPTTNERSAEQHESGTYSRKFVADADREGIKSDIFVMEPNKLYKVNFWVYPVDQTSVMISVERDSDGGKVLFEQIDTLVLNEWNEISRWIISDWTTNQNMRLIVDSGWMDSGTWYVDLVGVHDCGDALIYLCQPGTGKQFNLICAWTWDTHNQAMWVKWPWGSAEFLFALFMAAPGQQTSKIGYGLSHGTRIYTMPSWSEGYDKVPPGLESRYVGIIGYGKKVT